MASNNTTEKRSKLSSEIQMLVREYFEMENSTEFIPGKSTVPLMEPSYSWQEVNQAIESLLSTRITLNYSSSNKVYQFEKAWSEFIGTKNGIMVNSGSSANLLALFVLSNPALPNRIKPGDEIITPAVTWHTTISPIICVGAIPVLVDVSLDDYTIDVEAIEKAITPKTKAIMPVHLLGNPCKMDAILEIATKHNLFVNEDTCEAHGAEFDGQKCGSMGDIGTFSFFFSHHITTMEGGMLMTNNDEIAEIVRIMRSQGVIRNTKQRVKLENYYKNQNEYKDMDMGFIFANLGFNLRPTELNGGFGIEQIKKFESILTQRKENGQYWAKRLQRYNDLFHVPSESKKGRAWFSFPLIIKPNAPFSRMELIKYLNTCKIENRPIMAGDVSSQPAMKYFTHRKSAIPNAELIHKNGIFWGNNQNITELHREYVADCIDKFVAKYC